MLILSIVSTTAMAVRELPKVMYNVEEATTLISEKQFTDLHVITVPEASFIKVHFGKFQIPKGVIVRVRNVDSTEVYNYSKFSKDQHTKLENDDGVKSFSSMSISGDTAIVEVIGYNPSVKSVINRLHIDHYAVGLPEDQIDLLYEDYRLEAASSPESTCGAVDNKVPTPCIISEFPTEYERMRPVARITNGSGSLCTAWRVGPDNKLFTNNHCNQTQEHIAASEVWFNYEYTSCGGNERTVPVKVSGDTMLITDRDHDMTLFTVNNFELIESFGWFGLEPRDPVLGEFIYRGGHGSGRPKLATIESDMNASGFCEVDDVSRNGFGVDTDMGYWCDSIGGSSGSPVLLRHNGRAIALHHFGGCMNAGVKMSGIWGLVAPFFDYVIPDGDVDPGTGRIAPRADLQIDCTFGVCNFDGTGSTDEDGEVVSWAWDFGDGTTSTLSNGTKTYDTTGVYTVKLLVKDNDLNPGFAGLELPITLEGENIKPVPKFSYTDDNNYTGYFTSESFDWDGEIVETLWKFRDTGVMGDWTTVSSLTAEHTFQIGGAQVAYLAITDDFGHKLTYGKWITINGPVMNQSPNGNYRVDPVNTYDTFSFTDLSYDSDGEVVQWYWNFGDGTRYNTDGTPPNHTYVLPDGVDSKTYYSYYYIYDNHGAYGHHGVYVDVTTPPPNQPPVANFEYEATLTEVSFTDTSTDDRNEVIEWSWDFGDGNASTTQNPVHVYPAVLKDYDVTLTVTDAEGESDTVVSNVFVDPVAPSVIVLRLTTAKARKGKYDLRFIWSGAPTDEVNILRNGSSIGTFANDGNHQIQVKRKDRGTSYQVCEIKPPPRVSSCSNTVRLSF